ncbi:hypothetical protein H2509_13940 [Stappia sp. F7233]|uniref:Phage regulatory protein CII (CP76) n=1 Tax=Stappia albiluteola TaxID=2758565 RepID=A0A839AGF7_9HYPH|nr:phage regulatory CII family protein [Stappia albiluteola]MBA5778225.1 hypothetical protein [Stappia albiluteola]
MKHARPSSENERRALKSAVRMQLRQCGGQDSAASITRVSQQQLSAYGNADNERHENEHMPIDVLLDLTLDAGPVALTEICRLSGGAFVQLPSTHSDGVWAAEIGRAVKEGGEAAAKLCEALATGGTITAEEIRELDIVREISEAIEALIALRQHCNRVINAGEGDE